MRLSSAVAARPAVSFAQRALLSTLTMQTFNLDPFCFRQFDDPHSLGFLKNVQSAERPCSSGWLSGQFCAATADHIVIDCPSK